MDNSGQIIPMENLAADQIALLEKQKSDFNNIIEREE